MPHWRLGLVSRVVRDYDEAISFYVPKTTGQIFYGSAHGDAVDELPDDHEDADLYWTVPHRTDLDLGSRPVPQISPPKARSCALEMPSRAWRRPSPAPDPETPPGPGTRSHRPGSGFAGWGGELARDQQVGQDIDVDDDHARPWRLARSIAS